MSISVSFRRQAMESLVGGVSTLDAGPLSITTLEEAREFIRSYGYDMELEEDRKRVWSFHRRAVALIRDQILNPDEEIPDDLYDPGKLKDIEQLLIVCSQRENHLQPWACAILKVMHVYAHLNNDIFHMFPEEIQTQILKPIQSSVYEDGVTGKAVLGLASMGDQIQLEKFEVKPTKSLTSSVIKLLAKRDAYAMTLLDKIGIRFVTKNTFDSFRVLRFLHENYLLNFANTIPDQTTNRLYPLNLFFEAMDELRSKGTFAEEALIEDVLMRKIRAEQDRAEYVTKANSFSAPDYRFMKFISRQLIRIHLPEPHRELRFFYPFEIQIMDYETYLNNLQGPISHDKYKARQGRAARRRIFGFLKQDELED